MANASALLEAGIDFSDEGDVPAVSRRRLRSVRTLPGEIQEQTKRLAGLVPGRAD